MRPVALTITEEDLAAYPAGPLTSIVQIAGTLPPGETVTISFERTMPFSSTNRIVYHDAGWHPADASEIWMDGPLTGIDLTVSKQIRQR